MRAFQINSADTVATMLTDVVAGEVQILGTHLVVQAAEAIAFGHKVAITSMQEGDPVIKNLSVNSDGLPPADHRCSER